MLFVTGGAGFIGSNFILDHLALHPDETVVNIDKLTYAGNPYNLAALVHHPHYLFSHTDICDSEAIAGLLQQHQPRAIVHFAAESHVDRSIHAPHDFMHTNVTGTFTLLEAARHYWSGLPATQQQAFRFLHVSTDEVYGTLEPADPAFTESTPYAPNSPYAASKAASDHLVRAYCHTYGLPVLTTNCSNNYGPLQFPEKLIPLIILNALEGKALPIYGDGLQVRDWLHVTDHCAAIRAVLANGRIGQTYNIGGHNEHTNLDVVHTLCDVLQAITPRSQGHYRDLVTLIKDRPGHDRRYAINPAKIARELGWTPQETFETGIKKTVQWYLDNPQWIKTVRSGHYRDWMAQHYHALEGGQ